MLQLRRVEHMMRLLSLEASCNKLQSIISTFVL